MDTITDVADNVQVKVESSTDADDNNSLKENQRNNSNINQNRRGRGNFRGGRRQPFGQGENSKNARARGKKSFDNQSQEDRASMDGRMPRNQPRLPDEKFNERAAQLSGSTYDLPPIDTSERKFNGRNRLYIGNIGAEITEKDLEDLFAKYGECAETFINKEKNFGFIKLDYHCNAEKAKKELDGTVLKSRNLKIRFAPNSASIKIKNLTPFVSNELLLYAFSIFGEIERAIVCVDERGRPTGEGVIDFSRRGSALAAIRKCTDSCFFLTTSLRPCIVELYEAADNADGYCEKSINRKSLEYQNERERGPRFAGRGSFEEDYGTRWKKLFDMHCQKEEALKKELHLEIEKLSAQMEYARYEHETELLRNRLKERELAKEKQKREWEMRERLVEQERIRTEEMMRKSQEEMDTWARRQQEESSRRQDENELFLQAQSLDSLLDYQETGYGTPNQGFQNEQPVRDSTLFLSSYERPTVSRYPAENGGVWVTDTRQKRRKH